eukprot:CRZ03392.1 hypothetical protein [Spongospora subterranea]
MDGVLYHGKSLLAGASEFVDYLQRSNKKFLFLTNASERSPKELQEKLFRMGINVEETHFYTSALATASFMKKSSPRGGSAYVIGEPGLISALYDEGFTMNDHNPEWVVVGETRNYSYEKIEHAVHLVRAGARLLGTNCDTKDRMGASFVPGCAALIKPIEMVAEVDAYFVGKPNPMIMRTALNQLGVKRADTIVIGDRMDTDILGGMQANITTALILTGVTKCSDLKRFAYRPDIILPTIGHIVPGLHPSDADSSN